MTQRDDLSYLPTREAPAPVSGNGFVYILACSDGAIYVGSARDVADRLAEHGGPKGAKFTRDHPGARLVYVEGPLSNALASQRERQLKRWSRAKKLALIRNQIELLKAKPFDAPALSKRQRVEWLPLGTVRRGRPWGQPLTYDFTGITGKDVIFMIQSQTRNLEPEPILNRKTIDP